MVESAVDVRGRGRVFLGFRVMLDVGDFSQDSSISPTASSFSTLSPSSTAHVMGQVCNNERNRLTSLKKAPLQIPMYSPAKRGHSDFSNA